MVGARCAVSSCNNSYRIAKKRGRVLSLHSFPKDEPLKELWVEACSRGDAWNPDTSFVCSDHFELDDFISDQRLQLWTGIKWKPKLHPNAFPTRNLPTGDWKRRQLGEPCRFSMFQVMSIELESRLGKTLRENVDHEASAGVGSTDTSQASLQGITGRTPDPFCLNANGVPTSGVNGDGKTTESRGLSDVCCDCGSKSNDETECYSSSSQRDCRHGHKPLARPKGELSPLNPNPSDSPNSPKNQENVDSLSENSQPSPAKPCVIYSCSEFELFVNEET